MLCIEVHHNAMFAYGTILTLSPLKRDFKIILVSYDKKNLNIHAKLLDLLYPYRPLDKIV